MKRSLVNTGLHTFGFVNTEKLKMNLGLLVNMSCALMKDFTEEHVSRTYEIFSESLVLHSFNHSCHFTNGNKFAGFFLS